MATEELPEKKVNLSTFGFEFCSECPCRFSGCIVSVFINTRYSGKTVECRYSDLGSIMEEMKYPCLMHGELNKDRFTDSYNKTMKRLFDCDQFGYVSNERWRF